MPTPAEPVRVLGHLADLWQRPQHDGERRFPPAATAWSEAANAAWLDAGIAARAPFRVVSAPRPGSRLAWELDRLRGAGYAPVGAHWLPPRWWRRRASYRAAVAAIAAELPATAAGAAAVYGPKAHAELPPLLDLWPHVVLWPTAAALSRDALIRLRAAPVHPLGVPPGPAFADGGTRPPAEFFWHDVDHARFKLREDLLARGIEVPDAYRDGSTFDAATGRHRTFVAAAAPHVGRWTWRGRRRRAALAAHLLGAAARTAGPRGEAMHWLLFELLHEKGLPLSPAVLREALAGPRHGDKLHRKAAAGFYQGDAPSPASLDQLDAARQALLAAVPATADAP